MAKSGPICLAIVCAATTLLVAGWWSTCCNGPGTSDPPGAPRMLRLPQQLRRIEAEVAPAQQMTDERSVAVLYQQPQAAPSSLQPRIVEVAAPVGRGAAYVIHEPSAAGQVISEPKAPPSRHSQYEAIVIPEASRPPATTQPPDLATRPDFTSPPSVGLIVEPVRPAPPNSGSSFSVNQPAQTPANQQTPLAANASKEFHAAPAPADRNAYPTVVDAAAAQVAAERAIEIADWASAMAQRGMLYSARTELLHALTLIAQGLDAQHGTTMHAAALAAGVRALDEARDFSSRAGRSGSTIDVAAIAATHRTPQLNGVTPPTSPVVAQQQYFAAAQGQLAAAVAGQSAGSQILYRLGRLQTAMAAHDADPLALHGPQAIAFHQAALASDSRNWLAANELGVLYARYGHLADARQLLQHSVSIQPHVAGWQNLAAVHRRLGEIDLAERAERERDLVARQAAKSPAESAGIVRWVDTKTFAASGGSDIRWPAETAGKSAAATRK